jgi:hypothetical protein
MDISKELWRDPSVLDKLASRHYDALPYHNYGHSLSTSRYAESIGSQAIEHGIEIVMDVLPSAARWHDVGHRIGIVNPYTTQEKLAANIFTRELKVLGMPAELTNLGSDVIESTNYNETCKTPTAKCLRQADLMAGGVASNPFAFLNATVRLYKEDKIIRGEASPSFSLRKMLVMKDLLTYAEVGHGILAGLLEDVRLGDYQEDEIYAVKAARNVNLLLPDNLKRFLDSNLSQVIDYRPVNI